jgi:ABC-type branched-subunit amino acid transport system permease subunit
MIGGIGMQIAAVTGAVLYVMMWSVVLPPETTSSWTTTCSSRRFWSAWR